MTRYFAMLTAVFTALLLYAAPARAQNCETMVVDETGRLGAGGIATVEAAGNRLVNAGADVRVRVIPSAAAFGNLDQYLAGMQSQCASWRAADGGRKNNLLVVLVSMDRQSGVFFGEQWRSALDGRTAGIRTNSMNPRFRDGDFAGGISAGLDAAGRLIAAAAAPPSPVQPAPAPVIVNVPEPAGPPADYSGLWSVMGWGLGLLAFGLLAWGVWFLIRANGKRKAAQQQAQAKRSACSAAILEVDEPIQLLEARAGSLTSKVSAEDLGELTNLLNSAKAAARQATGRYGELQQSSANNPDVGGLSVEQYEAIAGEFENVLGLLRTAKTATGNVEEGFKKIQQRIAEAQPKIDALSAEIDKAVAAVEAVSAQGFKTDALEQPLEDAGQKLVDAQAALTAKRYGAIEGICKEGEKIAKKAAADAQGLAARRDASQASIAKLKARIPGMKTLIVETRPVFEAITAEYPEGSWQHVRGNGTEAQKRVEAALKAADEATDACAMTRQEWDVADATVVQANAWLDEASSFMKSISSLKANLDQAKRDAQPEIDAAQADLDKLAAYERAHDDDIRDSIKGEIAACGQLLDKARAELEQDKPDYFRALKFAQQANAAADKLFGEASDAHEAAERQRRRAVSSVRDAEAAISRAAEYIEDHSSDVESAAKGKLKAARATLTEAKATTSLATRIQKAEAAHKEADAAYKKAKSDVSDAEDARDRARRARERSYSSGSSGGDAFTGGLIGGMIGSSIGRGSSSSSGSGGGGFGGWGSSGGGGDSGGWGGSSGGGDSGSFGDSGGGGGDSGSW